MENRHASPSSTGGIVRAAAAVLLLLGLVSRAVPIAEGGDRALTQFPSEDAYLMLTISRNLARGLGLTTAEGRIPTNGTQPLATFLWAGAFVAVDAARETGVRVVLVLELLFSCLVAASIFLLGRSVLAGRAGARDAALLAAGLWFASPVHLGESMNCQETTLAALAAVAAAGPWLRLREDTRWPGTLGLGLLLGAAFWVRNDAVFLAGAVCALHLVCGGSGSPSAWRRRLAQSAAMGATAALVAAPWLAFNWIEFGSPVPISGRSQSMGVALGSSALRLPVVLGESLAPLLKIPTPAQDDALPSALGALVCLAAAALYARGWRRATARERKLVLLVLLLGAALAGYYGVFFGAPYFLRRYLFPLSPFLALGFAVAAVGLVRRSGALGAAAIPAALVALLAWQQPPLRLAGPPTSIHWAKVQWIRDHVESREWVAAIQSGAVGFFHDRTINLDGKVNPEALRARERGRLAAYVIRSPARWLIDWRLILRLMKAPAMQRAFEVILEEPRLVVIRRRDEPLPAAPSEAP